MKILDFRRENRLSQSAMAKIAGVSQSMIAHWEMGRRRITAEKAIYLEEVTHGELSRNDLRPDLWGNP